MPRITVITAVKDAAGLLPETIASIQAQTEPDWRYLIVDDASTDGTAAVVEQAAAADARIELVRLESSIGPYAAANLAARDVDSEYIARIDGDDIALPDRFRIQIAAMRSRPGARASTGAWRTLSAAGAISEVRPVPSTSNGVIKWMMWFRSNLVHSTLMIERACFHELGGYGPERIGEDFRTWAALVRADMLAITPDPLVLYRLRPNQMTAVEGARDQPERLRITLDHMTRCTDTDWALDDARDFRWIGEAAEYPPSRALLLLDRFERAWQADDALDDADRAELARHTAKRRLRHLRRALRRSPPAVAFVTVRFAGAVLRSSAHVATHRGPAWP